MFYFIIIMVFKKAIKFCNKSKKIEIVQLIYKMWVYFLASW